MSVKEKFTRLELSSTSQVSFNVGKILEIIRKIPDFKDLQNRRICLGTISNFSSINSEARESNKKYAAELARNLAEVAFFDGMNILTEIVSPFENKSETKGIPGNFELASRDQFLEWNFKVILELRHDKDTDNRHRYGIENAFFFGANISIFLEISPKS